MEKFVASIFFLLVSVTPAFAWVGPYEIPGPAPNPGPGQMVAPPQTMQFQNLGQGTQMYQNPYNPQQSGIVRDLGNGTTLTQPNYGGPSVICHTSGNQTICN